ncbi:hypothetical protein DPX16_6232 [Anabarilius grahami]|uniref:Uncharacterized protein n=1 Tax=Anabarilius grahami TaxID=495550 RepID=A0A3N0XEI5_ANAGA|nr:hypothetical protein DPX16_6232 [Anabarilius grahami]
MGSGMESSNQSAELHFLQGNQVNQAVDPRETVVCHKSSHGNLQKQPFSSLLCSVSQDEFLIVQGWREPLKAEYGLEDDCLVEDNGFDDLPGDDGQNMNEVWN